MAQVILFIVALLVLMAKGVTFFLAAAYALAIAVIGGFILMAFISRKL